jgi:hypothetical protein
MGDTNRVCMDVFKGPGDYEDPTNHVTMSYIPVDKYSKRAKAFGHSGADFYTLWNAMEYILGNEDAKIIDVYQAIDMWIPGLFAHFSALEGSKELAIPDLRDPAQRDAYRNDNRCTNPEKAGDMWIPSYSQGEPIVPDEVYEAAREKWDKKVANELANGFGVTKSHI